MQMSHIPYAYRSSTAPSSSMRYFMSLFKIMRLAFVCAFMLLAVLVFILYSFNHLLLPKARVVAQNISTNQSPLQILLSKDQAIQEELRDGDCELLEKINHRSTLELKTLVIAETVVPYEDREKLGEYVSKQLEASGVVSNVLACAVTTMIKLAPTEASVSKEEMGQSGTLRNSAMLALIKTHLNNVHFMFVGVRAEPRLGWRWIEASERNSWNNVLSRVLAKKVRVEAQNCLWQHHHNVYDAGDREPSIVLQDKTEKKLVLPQLLPESFDLWK